MTRFFRSAILSLVAARLCSASPESVHALDPALTPDGQQIIFAWSGDLWSVELDGGQARRLTTHPADDSQPQVSPDGRTLFFTSLRDGPRHLFSMPMTGGTILRHSHHSEGLRMESLSSDGRSAIIRALRDSPAVEGRRLFALPLDAPSEGERLLFDFDAHSISLHKDGRMLFCRNGGSIHRKGYRGSDASSIWLRDSDGGVRKLIAEQAGARSPIWHPSGRSFYYLSDRDGTWNVWRHSLDQRRNMQLTRFKNDGVLQMTLSLDGKTMVFTKGFSLWSWNPESKEKPMEIQITAYPEAMIPDLELRQIRSTGEVDFSVSGLEMVFAAEGALFTMDTVLKEPNRITSELSAWESPRFVAGGQAILAIEDTGLTRRLVRIERAGDERDYWWKHRDFATIVLAGDTQSVAAFKPSRDGKSVAWVDVTGGLHFQSADASGGAKKLFQGWQPFEFDISPDGVWIALAPESSDFNRDVHIVPTDGSGPAYNVTRHPGWEGVPRWSPDGRKLAFIGERVTGQTRVHIVHLSAADHLRTNEDLQRALAEETMKKDPAYEPREESTGSASEAPKPTTAVQATNGPVKPEAETEKPGPVVIDFDGLYERVIPLETDALTPSHLVWTSDSKSLLYQETRSMEQVVRRIDAQRGAKPIDHAAFLGTPVRMASDETSYWIVDGAPALWQKGKLTRYTFSTEMQRSRRQHQALGFNVAWRMLGDQFYDPALNGLDWEKIRLKYLPAATNARTSSEYELIFERMFGELNASHLNFQATPWPPYTPDPASRWSVTRHTGISFRTDATSGRIEVAQVLPGSPASLAEPPIRMGAELLEVDDSPVPPRACLARLFNGSMDDEVRVVVRDPGGETHEYHFAPIGFDTARALARAELVRDVRRSIEPRTGGKVGYVPIRTMRQDNFHEFQRQVFAEGEGKDGLIIDIRDNPGGSIADHLLTILTQPRHSFTIPRNGSVGNAGERTIYAVWDKPVTVLINQNSFSNAEVFAHAIKTMGRGKLVGVPTGGGVISSRRRSVLDLGSMLIPFRGWFHPETGRDLELGPAVPDRIVEITPADLMVGRDPQLDAAVEILLTEIEAGRKPGPAPIYRREAMGGKK